LVGWDRKRAGDQEKVSKQEKNRTVDIVLVVHQNGSEAAIAIPA